MRDSDLRGPALDAPVILDADSDADEGASGWAVVVSAPAGPPFTWTGIDRVLSVYPSLPAALALAEAVEE